MNLNALVIDDIQHNLEHYNVILTELGVHTFLAETAEEGLRIVEKNHIDLIFLDYWLPGMNGFEFADAYRNLPQGKNSPIIMISSDLSINQAAVKRGIAQAWLVKKTTKIQVEITIKSLGLW